MEEDKKPEELNDEKLAEAVGGVNICDGVYRPGSSSLHAQNAIYKGEKINAALLGSAGANTAGTGTRSQMKSLSDFMDEQKQSKL